MADQETSKNVNPEDDDLIREAEACACEKEEPCQNNDTCQNNDACANESATEPTLEKEEKSKKDSSEPSVSETEVLKAALSASNDRYLRLMAEFDNYRRRTTKEQLEITLKSSKASKKINNSFIERQNGTDRSRNSRKIRRSPGF